MAPSIKTKQVVCEPWITQVPKMKTIQFGVDVMITIFCDFCKFSAKKTAFFSKTNVMINFFQNLALF
jgi:hypothetical protein